MAAFGTLLADATALPAFHDSSSIPLRFRFALPHRIERFYSQGPLITPLPSFSLAVFYSNRAAPALVLLTETATILYDAVMAVPRSVAQVLLYE